VVCSISGWLQLLIAVLGGGIEYTGDDIDGEQHIDRRAECRQARARQVAGRQIGSELRIGLAPANWHRQD
jgi:hypothetical protein